MPDPLSLRLPRLVYVDDYHEFGHLQDLLRDLTGSKRVKVVELGLENGPVGHSRYIGVVYTRKDSAFKELVSSVELLHDQ